MTPISITIEKEQVYEEVAQTTAYTGAKMDGDEDAYDRISTIDEDQGLLERFWNESCVAVCGKLRRFLKGGFTEESSKFALVLEVPSGFNPALLVSMQKELFSFFVMNITAKWYAFTNKKEAGDYAVSAMTLLEGVHRKACYKKKPSRPVYD
ncbi:MAG: hypothetical protein NC212_08520 [Staphylococcus sp.]|nr:hypothetical protein [Staphylococcus sp.]